MISTTQQGSKLKKILVANLRLVMKIGRNFETFSHKINWGHLINK